MVTGATGGWWWSSQGPWAAAQLFPVLGLCTYSFQGLWDLRLPVTWVSRHVGDGCCVGKLCPTGASSRLAATLTVGVSSPLLRPGY